MTAIINSCVSHLNQLGDTFVPYAAGTLVQSTLLILLLFGTDVLLRKRVRAVVRYCVWLLVLVKLVLPPGLSLPTGIGYWLGDRLPVASSAPTVGFEATEQAI